MTSTTGAADLDDPVERLRRAAETRDRERTAVDSIGEDTLRRLREKRDELVRLLDAYEERATGDGDFKAFIEFQEKIAAFTEGLPEDLPERETFETIDETLQRRRLRTKEFDKVRDLLASIDRTLSPLDAWEDSLEEYRVARRAVRAELDAVEDEIADLERLSRLGEVDLDAPVEHLREPIEAYDAAAMDAFATLRDEQPAREVVEFLDATAAYPLVPFDPPPADFADYVRDADVGSEPIPELLRYADQSRSKLTHYVDEPGTLKRVVGGRRTYLTRLDGEPLTVGWPPPDAGTLRFRSEELISVAAKLDRELVSTLREVRALASREDYDRLRESALADDELTADERRRLASGDVSAELDAAREKRQRLTDSLAEYPAP